MNWNPITNPVYIGDADLKQSSFESLLDTACERLHEKQVELSVRRINELEEKLETLEKELSEFLRKQL